MLVIDDSLDQTDQSFGTEPCDSLMEVMKIP